MAVALALVGRRQPDPARAGGAATLRALDWGIEIAAGLLIVASFLAQWRVVPEQRMPGRLRVPACSGRACCLGIGVVRGDRASRGRRAGEAVPPSAPGRAGRL